MLNITIPINIITPTVWISNPIVYIASIKEILPYFVYNDLKRVKGVINGGNS